MNNSLKILNPGDRICLFCGQPEKEYNDKYDKYYECDCKDAVEDRKIRKQIEELKHKLPKPKYEITVERVLHSI